MVEAVGNFLRLIRVSNLLIIALTQYLLRWFVIKPMLEINDFELQMSELDFFLLSLSSVMIAAAGYIINDYFDLKIDLINKPDRIIVGKQIKRRVAMGAHIVINLLGLAIGLYVAMKVGMWKLIFIQVFWMVSLWYYSTTFKYQFLVGNLVISVCTAMVPMAVGLYEVPLLTKAYFPMLSELGMNFNFIAYWVVGYSVFAFFFTLTRELTKDVADMEGDEKHGCRTVPIVWGIGKTKVLINVLYLIILVLCFYIQQKHLNDHKTFLYFLLGIAIPTLVLMVKVQLAKDSKAFSVLSAWNKIISLMGLFYTLLVYYIITNNLS